MGPEALMARVAAWAQADGRIRGVAVCGSHARGEARPDSDVDLVLICADPGALLDDRSWTRLFGEALGTGLEDYGRVRSLRVSYRGGPEVEFGLTSPDWAAQPLDPGTTTVLRDGFRVLYDPDGLLAAALDSALAGGAVQEAGATHLLRKAGSVLPAG